MCLQVGTKLFDHNSPLLTTSFSLVVNLVFRHTAPSGVQALIFWASVLLIMFASRSVSVLETWILSRWAREYEDGDPPPSTALQ